MRVREHGISPSLVCDVCVRETVSPIVPLDGVLLCSLNAFEFNADYVTLFSTRTHNRSPSFYFNLAIWWKFSFRLSKRFAGRDKLPTKESMGREKSRANNMKK